MMPGRSSLTDPIEAVVARTRPSAEAIFRQNGLSADDARQVLLDAAQWLESPRGIIPGAGNRLIKTIEAASRRIRNESSIEAPPVSSYDPAFADLVNTVRSRRIESERATKLSAALIARLEQIPAEEAERLLADPSLDISKELVRALLDRSKELWKSDPALSLTVTRQALALLARLPSCGADHRYLADLEARSHSYAGNAFRLLCDYRRAERAFKMSEAALSRGTQDPRERAQLLMQLATLRRDQGHFGDALRQLQQSAAIYRWTREEHSEGLILVLMANTQAFAGHPELAVPLAERARELLDHQRDPRMSAGLEKNMAHYLYAADRVEDARRQLNLSRPLVERHGTPNDLRGLRWIEGQIALALGERDEGERLLTAVREEYVELGDSFNAALVSLELVAAYLDQGRAADAKRLAAESLPIFQSLEIHRETLAALIALQRATELETATAGVVRELLERLRRGNAAAPPRPERPS